MSVVAGAGPEDFTIDITQTKPIPFARLVKVELRKLYDTQASFWLLVVIGAITLLAVALVVVFTLLSEGGEVTFDSLTKATERPQGTLLPALAILLVTSEFSQRSALTTFVLEPHRWRVIAAKAVTVIMAGFAFWLLAVGSSALLALLLGGDQAFAGITAAVLGHKLLMQQIVMIMAFGFGLLFLNSPAALVVFYVVPNMFTIVIALAGIKFESVREIAKWIDLGTAQGPLMGADALSGQQWAQLGSAFAIWVLLPLLLGLARVLRAEVK